ncbi:MAG: O-antigen ligase family protein [Lachnospiraceae bacterium]|nr:O-antigen ligase family protein [Lachnospiraceae bacterium]
MSKKRRSNSSNLRSTSEVLLNDLINLYLFCLICIFPFYMTNGYANLGTDKAVFLRNLAVSFSVIFILILSIAFIADKIGSRSVTNNKGNKKKSKANVSGHVQKNAKANVSGHMNSNPNDISEQTSGSIKWIVTNPAFTLGVYAVTILISFIASSYKADSLSGSEGWYMGLLTQVSLLITAFAIYKYWQPSLVIFRLAAIVSGILFIWAVLNRFDIYPIQLAYARPVSLASLGNINWFCGYLSLAFPLSLGYLSYKIAGLDLFRDRTLDKREIFSLPVIAGVVHLFLSCAITMLQGSDSAILILAVSFIAFSLVSDTYVTKVSLYICGTLTCIMLVILRLLINIFDLGINYSSVTISVLTKGPLLYIVTVLMLIICCLFFIPAYSQNHKSNTGRSLRSFPQIKTVNRILLIALLVITSLTVIAFILNSVLPAFLPMGGDSFIFSDNWGNGRGFIWKVSLKLFGSGSILNKLFGFGPDAYSCVAYGDLSPVRDELLAFFGNVKLTNAHNELITILINTGIPGVIAFVCMMISVIKAGIKKADPNTSVKNGNNVDNDTVALIMAVSLITYLIHNIVSFQHPLNLPYMYAIIGMISVYKKVAN